MKLLRLMLALTFVTLFAHVTAADSTDPAIGFGGTGSIAPTSCSAGFAFEGTACNLDGGTDTIVVGIPNANASNACSTCVVDVFNSTDDDDFLSLTITDTNLPIGEAISCAAPTEFFAAVTQTGPDSCTFTGEGYIPDDLPPGYEAGIYLTGFDDGSPVDLSASVPEPSSILLLGIGLLSLFGIQKRRGIAKSEA